MKGYVWTKTKQLGIRHARKAQTGSPLSGVVIVAEDGTGFCYIRFDAVCVQILGQRMPYGIGPENTAYLKVVKMHKHYDVWCCYTDKSKSVKLWKSDKLPEWVRGIKHAKEEAA